MKAIYTRIAAAAAAFIWAVAAGASADSGAPYLGLSAEISRYAAASGVKKLVVADFSARGGAEQSEADYISEKISGCLGAGGGPELVDREFLKRIMLEVGYSKAAGSPYQRKLRGEIESVDAVVAGTVFAAGGKVRVLVRLIGAKSGKVLFTAEAETRRDWPGADGAGERGQPASAGGVYQLTPELPGILVPASAGGPPAERPYRPADLRDAVAESAGNTCAARAQRLAWRNEQLVDAKAEYWARKMREPGYLSTGLRANPGSEISDPAIKARFYELLVGYYNGRAPERPEGGRLAEVEQLVKDEAGFAGDCGAP